jgi:protein tyrosine/serine phosphatase
MNPLFQKLYKHKKTRVRDPNLPPPPNLFSTVRDLKLTQSAVDNNTAQLRAMEERIRRLETRNNYLEQYVELLRNQLSKK